MMNETKKATRESYGEALINLGEKNKNVVVLDADVATATKTIEFAKKYPDRFFDIGIAEADMMGTAAGMSTCGKIPYVSTFAVFAAGRAYDQNPWIYSPGRHPPKAPDNFPSDRHRDPSWIRHSLRPGVHAL